MCLGDLENFWTILNVPNLGHLLQALPMDHADAQTLAKPPFMRICREFEIGAIYALYPECFCDKNLAIRKVFAFCDSAAPFRLCM